MGGGLMQLVAYGAQDIYLTGNPQITFFKVVYRRHTNFSMESIDQTLTGSQAFGAKVTATISRNGDLIHKMYVEYSPLTMLGTGDVGHVCANVGNTLLKEIELEIGGQRVDRHFSHWLTVWTQLTEVNPTGAAAVAADNTGAEPSSGATLAQLMAYNHNGFACDNTQSTAPAVAHVPLQFWFCRNPGLALPLIALQYHEVKVNITFCAAADLVATAGNVTFSNTKLWVDYIYLDTDERRRFAQQSHEYLIEQLQFQQQGSATATRTELNFNHPVKELIWTGVPDSTAVDTESHFSGPATPGQLGTDGDTVVAGDTYLLKLNGHERFAARHLHYFTRTQLYQHHTGFGGLQQRDSIAVYSFALKPEEHQPSGTCNFSRIDNAVMEHTAHAAANAGATAVRGRNAGINFYAVNYNVLRIMSGMGGLAYSN